MHVCTSFNLIQLGVIGNFFPKRFHKINYVYGFFLSVNSGRNCFTKSTTGRRHLRRSVRPVLPEAGDERERKVRRVDTEVGGPGFDAMIYVFGDFRQF
jgi:hypothetical protein